MSHRSSITTPLLVGASIFILVGASACASQPGSAAPQTGSFNSDAGEFAPCPDSPNCVSTQAADATHAIAPYTFSGASAEAMSRMLDVINEMPRTQVVSHTDTYLHVEFRSRIFRFVDDVEFFFNEADSTVQFRSASRVGYSDLGVNRKRMEEIRTRFNDR